MKKYGFWDKKKNWPNIINPIYCFDVMNHMYLYTKLNRDVKKTSLPYILEYMGVGKKTIDENAHDAKFDTMQTALIARKFLKLFNFLTEDIQSSGKPRLQFKDCLLLIVLKMFV